MRFAPAGYLNVFVPVNNPPPCGGCQYLREQKSLFLFGGDIMRFAHISITKLFLGVIVITIAGFIPFCYHKY
jgi:hypothetical protein